MSLEYEPSWEPLHISAKSYGSSTFEPLIARRASNKIETEKKTKRPPGEKTKRPPDQETVRASLVEFAS